MPLAPLFLPLFPPPLSTLFRVLSGSFILKKSITGDFTPILLLFYISFVTMGPDREEHPLCRLRIMFSLQRFFCRDEKFFDLIESLAQASSASVKTLAQVLLHPEEMRSVDEVVRMRRKCKEYNDEIAHDLCVSFVTPLEREDIESLATSLTKISKTSEKFVSQYCVFRSAVQHEDFRKQSELMDQAADVLVKMVNQLRHKADVKQVKELNSQLRFYETEADRVMLSLLQQLFSGERKTMNTPQEMASVLATKNLQELLEKLIDRFRDAGNIVFRIVLKYS